MATFTVDDVKQLIKEVVGESLEEAKEKQTHTVENIVKEPPPAPEKPEKGVIAAQFVRALAAGKGDVERAGRWAKKALGEDSPVTKALLATDNVSGGFLIPEEFSADVIELLGARVALRRLNPVVIPMEHGTLTIPKLTGGATAYYQDEDADATKSEQTFGQVKLSWKKLVTLVPVSNDLLRYSAPSVDALVRDDMVNAMSRREDLAFIRGTGTDYTPKGLLNWCPGGNKTAANGTVNLTNVTLDIGKIITTLANADVRMIRPGWLFHPRTEWYLKTVRDANGNFAFKEEMDRGNLFTFPYATTTQIPINLGSDESEVYLADFADIIIGESMRLSIDVSTEAAYLENSTVKSAFSRDETVIRAIAEHDLVVRHEQSIAMLTTVKWFAA